jgi:hypothetical protein
MRRIRLVGIYEDGMVEREAWRRALNIIIYILKTRSQCSVRAKDVLNVDDETTRLRSERTE